MRQLVLGVTVAALAAAIGACTDRNDVAGARPVASVAPAPPAEAPASPAPSSAALAPVVGERVPGAYDVDATGLLAHGRGDPADPDVVLPFVHAVGDWLDAHLDDLQRGGAGRLDEVAPPALLRAASPSDLDAATTALATPGRPVARATYRLDASYAGEVEWVTVDVTVTATDGSRAGATLVFVPDGGGRPQLVLLGAREGAA